MRFARAVGVIGLCCLVGCVSHEGFERATYIVQRDDTLYSIAWRHNLDYRALARWNGIGPDYHIAVGQTLWLAPPSEVNPSSPAAAQASTTPTPAPSSGRWLWPTAALSAPHSMAGGGVLIEGVLGQPVRASDAGHVVYVGNGIRNFGNLIIIKHDENFLSAYAHAREVSVQEGEHVERGQVIAQMGVGPHQAPALYFEIRLNGKSVDPIPYLSGQK